MSWYSTPIQPIDPVVVSQQPKPSFRYLRDNFAGTGQNSYVKPPAQDQSMWQALTNIQPITQGVLNQRWGYVPFHSSMTNAPNRLYNFQSDSLGTRAILPCGSGGILALNEDGSVYNPNVFTPTGAGIIRSLTSRNFQYFCDGNNTLNPSTHLTGDSLKWNGAATGGVTNIGIVNTDVTQNNSSGGTSGNSVGPSTGTTASDTGGGNVAWTNPAGAFTNSFGTAAFANIYNTWIQIVNHGQTIYIPSGGAPNTDKLQALGFFNSASGSGVAGIQVAITYKATPTGGAATRGGSIIAQIVKNGVVTGTTHSAGIGADGGTHTALFGAANDLWGGSFALADIVASNFGVTFSGSCTTANVHAAGNYGFNLQVAYVTITVTFTGTTGTSTSSGAGVGILSAVGGGSVNLTLGRTYYLVANTATVGHFSDLSVASSSTGAATNAEFNLILATYNDPQVDTKYVLATADGGDPSILYEVQVLVPGLTISSWSINGSNVVTFTGVYTGPQYTTGQTFVVGGLSHGSYLNGQTLTVTGSSPTTVVANFTHGADSATEIGIAGNLSFAIPNGVKTVVDNNPDPNLVLNQPLVFTDTNGNEFGLTLNTPPPAGNLIIKHQGRLWMAGVTGATHSVFFSKSVSELTLPNGFIAGKYEEAWPGSNYFDVSDGAESVTGFLSDGTTLYIGTQNHIRRFLGNSPVNFQEPQIVHPEVGLLNQEVAQIVFMQGSPSGAIWMTPDFRVIQSDFNTYVDIGTPIQDILNNLQSTAQSLAHAAFVADGEFELYILAVPYLQSSYCDTHLVFDLRNRQWYVWQPNNGSVSLLFNITQAGVPQWLFIGSAQVTVQQYMSTATDDQGVAIPVSATTTWLHLGEATRRKMLNEVQVYGNTGMTMTINGSNNLADFADPRPVVYNRTLKQSPFGTWNLYLTGSKTRYRYYQFTFSSSNGQVPLLGSYAISTTPLDDL